MYASQTGATPSTGGSTSYNTKPPANNPRSGADNEDLKHVPLSGGTIDLSNVAAALQLAAEPALVKELPVFHGAVGQCGAWWAEIKNCLQYCNINIYSPKALQKIESSLQGVAAMEFRRLKLNNSSLDNMHLGDLLVRRFDGLVPAKIEKKLQKSNNLITNL